MNAFVLSLCLFTANPEGGMVNTPETAEAQIEHLQNHVKDLEAKIQYLQTRNLYKEKAINNPWTKDEIAQEVENRILDLVSIDVGKLNYVQWTQSVMDTDAARRIISLDCTHDDLAKATFYLLRSEGYHKAAIDRSKRKPLGDLSQKRKETYTKFVKRISEPPRPCPSKEKKNDG